MKKNFKYIIFLFAIFFMFSSTVFGQSQTADATGFSDNSIICVGKTGEFIKDVFHLVKFAVPIVIIGLGIVDFIKAMTAQSQDEVKKASSKLIKRLIIGVCIFVLPTILDFLLKIAEINSELCGW